MQSFQQMSHSTWGWGVTSSGPASSVSTTHHHPQFYIPSPSVRTFHTNPPATPPAARSSSQFSRVPTWKNNEWLNKAGLGRTLQFTLYNPNVAPNLFPERIVSLDPVRGHAANGCSGLQWTQLWRHNAQTAVTQVQPLTSRASLEISAD